jgi:O-antigen ligase
MILAIQSKKTAFLPHILPHLLFWFAAILTATLLAYGIATRTQDTLFWSGIAALTYLLLRRENLALYVFIFLPVIGEMVRLPWGPENGILPGDLFIPLFTGIWIVKKIITKKALPPSGLLKPFLVFCLIAGLSLLQAFLFLKPSEVLTGSFYLVRLGSYTLLYLVAFDSIKEEKHAKKLLTAATISALLIAVAGFIQLVIYPDMGKLEEYGWDPHQNRLVSTWLDPNFVGGLLAVIICTLLGVSFYVKSLRNRLIILAASAVMGVAVFLTYSRSAWLALAAGIIVISLLKSRKLLIICLIVAATGIAVLPRAEQRLTDLSRSISSFIFNTSETPDATARLRIKSWEQTWQLIGKRPLLGSGYNTLRYVKFNEGFVEDPAVHSASGSDSSLLTILAATGVAGLIPFLWFYAVLLNTAWKNFRHRNAPLFSKGYSLGFLAAIIALLTHSFFVNSLLFPQILVFLAVQIGILVWIESRRRVVK